MQVYRMRGLLPLVGILRVLPGHGQELSSLARPYDPVVVTGSALSEFAQVPTGSICLYAYRARENRWELIPFQIDERVAIIDPWDPPNIRLSYFTPDDGRLDADDELCFLCRDAGDRAPLSSWPATPAVEAGSRIELEIRDPLDGGRGWVYTYRCRGDCPSPPSPYGLSYDPLRDEAKSIAYRLRFGARTGLVEDVAIVYPFGTDVDFFDTQKIRMVGLITAFNLTLPFGRDWNPYAANERDNLFIYPDSTRWTPRPVVRVVRQALQAVRFGIFVFHDARFPVETKLYPFSGRVSGGTDLSTLGELVDVEVDLLRQSWDFSANAVGMRLTTRRNREVIIDGAPDILDTRVDLPVREWFLASGDQGSFFVQIALRDTLSRTQSLYYRDDRRGGQGDGTVVEGGDTGYDGASYGDIGILARGPMVRPNLQLDFAAYFLPARQPPEMGERLAAWVTTPVRVNVSVQRPSGVSPRDAEAALPSIAQLSPLFPNPFRLSTSCRVRVSAPTSISVRVIDAAGRTVRTLWAGSVGPGQREVVWDGCDDAGVRCPAGRYLLVLKAKNVVDTQPVVLLR
ncbi:MAG: hypothetical protein ONB23_13080 [candidate division KSB1 bacterium]|nr:hypothetical protein [candidate division KSB1 bacterium]